MPSLSTVVRSLDLIHQNRAPSETNWWQVRDRNLQVVAMAGTLFCPLAAVPCHALSSRAWHTALPGSCAWAAPFERWCHLASVVLLLLERRESLAHWLVFKPPLSVAPETGCSLLKEGPAQ